MTVPSGRQPRAVALVGATGLVGGECLRLLVREPAFSRVVALTRRPLPASVEARETVTTLEAAVVDFDDPASYAPHLAVDAVICALGTTIKVAGSQERFRHVDYDYPLGIARAALDRGASHYLLVSSAGADPRSRVFYSRVKGELEQSLRALPFMSVTIVRPSLLLGPREQVRLGEAIAKRLAFLVPDKYKPVQASAVAAVLVDQARQARAGQRVIESAEIRRLAAAMPAADA